MSCCGKKRAALNESVSPEPVRSSQPNAETPEGSLFEYTGRTGLTVKGNITGMMYRFNKTGDRQLVDYRDAGSMMALSMLKRIKEP